MPDATGYDVIKALKELDKVPKIGIVTGSNEMLASVDENALNIDLIIKKPFKLLELASKINVLFDNG
jgi:DNA-binding response OmpR family regulator